MTKELISEMDIKELKVSAYDTLISIEKLKNQLVMIQQAILQKNQIKESKREDKQ